MHNFVKVCCILFILYLLMSCLAGCISLEDTLRDISNDLGGYIQEASDVDNVIRIDGGLPTLFGAGVVGYGMAFVRRLYVNWSKRKNGK